MQDPPDPYMQMIMRCEDAIARIRATRITDPSSEQAGQDMIMIRDAVKPVFVRESRRVAHLAPEVEQEAYERMCDRLYEDIYKTEFPSMETGFGSYLKTMPWRVCETIRKKYRSSDVSLTVERLDATDDTDTPAHERIADISAEEAFMTEDMLASIEEALPWLTPAERFVWRRRYEGHPNGDVARMLGVGDAKASTLYTSACRKLKARIEGPEE